ncbi:MAG: DNA-deoxyinosine glycosylase [Gammaproteobacteria bacterium]|nr:MAG: DNA-deoxyinosine glycosylase [Gammaproteobacteria bacterium]
MSERVIISAVPSLRPLARAHKVASFPPQVGMDCRVLVLGTVPSVRSLQLRQSYGHAQNLFWPLMGTLFDAGVELPYAERIRRLQAIGIGIWDVYKRVERRGSLDASIVRASEVPNAIVRLWDLSPAQVGKVFPQTRAADLRLV